MVEVKIDDTFLGDNEEIYYTTNDVDTIVTTKNYGKVHINKELYEFIGMQWENCNKSKEEEITYYVFKLT